MIVQPTYRRSGPANVCLGSPNLTGLTPDEIASALNKIKSLTDLEILSKSPHLNNGGAVHARINSKETELTLTPGNNKSLTYISRQELEALLQKGLQDALNIKHITFQQLDGKESVIFIMVSRDDVSNEFLISVAYKERGAILNAEELNPRFAFVENEEITESTPPPNPSLQIDSQALAQPRKLIATTQELRKPKVTEQGTSSEELLFSKLEELKEKERQARIYAEKKDDKPKTKELNNTISKPTLGTLIEGILAFRKIRSKEMQWFWGDCKEELNETQRIKLIAALKNPHYSSKPIALYIGQKMDFLLTCKNVMEEIKWATDKTKRKLKTNPETENNNETDEESPIKRQETYVTNYNHSLAAGYACNPELPSLVERVSGQAALANLIRWSFENMHTEFGGSFVRHLATSSPESILELVKEVLGPNGKDMRSGFSSVVQLINYKDKAIRDVLIPLLKEERNKSKSATRIIGAKLVQFRGAMKQSEIESLDNWSKENKKHVLSLTWLGQYDRETKREMGLVPGKQSQLLSLSQPQDAKTMPINMKRRTQLISQATKQEHVKKEALFYFGQNENLITAHSVIKLIPWAILNPDHKFAEGFGLNEKLQDPNILAPALREVLLFWAGEHSETGFGKSILTTFTQEENDPQTQAKKIFEGLKCAPEIAYYLEIKNNNILSSLIELSINRESSEAIFYLGQNAFLLSSQEVTSSLVRWTMQNPNHAFSAGLSLNKKLAKMLSPEVLAELTSWCNESNNNSTLFGKGVSTFLQNTQSKFLNLV